VAGVANNIAKTRRIVKIRQRGPDCRAPPMELGRGRFWKTPIATGRYISGGRPNLAFRGQVAGSWVLCPSQAR